MPAPLAGTVFLKADGQEFQLRAQLTINPGKVTREGVAGQDGVHGYTEAPMVPYISGTLTDSAQLSTEQLEAITDATVTAELINGKTYVLRNAWYTGTQDINTEDGSMPFRFEGLACEEVLP